MTPREVACLIVDIRMGGMTGLELQRPVDRTPVAPAHRLHHRPRRRAHGRGHHEKGRDGLHPEALQRRPARQPGGAHAGAGQGLFCRLPRCRQPRRACCAKLTPREAQVLERIVAGRLNKQIADDLGISIKTRGGAPRQHHGKAQRQHRGRPAQNRTWDKTAPKVKVCLVTRFTLPVKLPTAAFFLPARISALRAPA